MTFQEKLRYFKYFLFVPIILVLISLPFAALISFAIYIIVYAISCFFPNYGEFINCTEVLLDEDYTNLIPQTSIVVSLTLQGNISLEELRSRFTKNALQARSKTKPYQLLYPKLKQYLTTFICFRIWKNDPNFHVQNHILEKNCDDADIANLHQDYHNKPYQKQRSPWELILIRNVDLDDNLENGPTSVLVLRWHHVVGDAISMFKLIVEDLGNQQGKTHSSVLIHETWWDKLQFILWFPIKYSLDNFRIIKLLYGSFEHPWRFKDWIVKSNLKTSKTVVAFSSKISVSNLKQVAKQNNVRTSAVVISILAGAIRKNCGKHWDKEVAIGYPLPLPNHPEGLTNHVTATLLRLPTDQQCEYRRLQQCNLELSQLADGQKGRYTKVAGLFAGVQIFPINRLFVNPLVPIAITNNAGSIDEFSVGKTKCIDNHGSVGTLRGAIGVVFCTISYKDGMRIAVIAKDSILSKEIAHNVAKDIEHELQVLQEAPK